MDKNTTLSSMCSRAVRALESSPGLIMMMDNSQFRFKQVEQRSKDLADLALRIWPAI